MSTKFSKNIELCAQDLRCVLHDHERTFTLQINNFCLVSGEVLGLVGESGAGKTLFLELLGLLRQPEQGSSYGIKTSRGVRSLLKTEAEKITSILQSLLQILSPEEKNSIRANRAELFGFIPQTGGLIQYLNAWDNVALPQHLLQRTNTEWLNYLFEALEINSLKRLYPEKLSIGQRQRVAVARAIAHRPRFVIADEPTSALDPNNAESVLKLLLDLTHKQSIGVILSSHNIDLLGKMHIPCVRLVPKPDSSTQNVAFTLNDERGYE